MDYNKRINRIMFLLMLGLVLLTCSTVLNVVQLLNTLE